jgi:hypothetical protein
MGIKNLSLKRRKPDSLEYSLYMKAQINAIEKSKYIESEKAKRDLFFDSEGKPSQAFYIWWISNHGKNFREAWKNSVCQRCLKITQCKDCLKEACDNFSQNPDLEPNMHKNIKLFLSQYIFKLDRFLHPTAYERKK